MSRSDEAYEDLKNVAKIKARLAQYKALEILSKEKTQELPMEHQQRLKDILGNNWKRQLEELKEFLITEKITL